MKHAEYVEQAGFCREMAEHSPSPERKAEWLRLAKLWDSLSQLTAVPRHKDPIMQAIIQDSAEKGRK